MQATPKAKPAVGRRPGDSGTREAILDAALEAFARDGYEGTSMRRIAAAAEVDPALVRHFFGHKDTLFAAAVLDRTDIGARVVSAFDGDPAHLGRRLTEVFFSYWEDPTTARLLTALVRAALNSTTAKDAIMGLHAIQQVMQRPDAPAGGERGLSLAISHLFGVAAFRHIAQARALTEMPLDELIAEVAPTVQRQLSGEAA